MKRKTLISLVLASFFTIMAIHGVEAQGSISGDGICGSSATTACKLSDLKTVTMKAFRVIISLGLPMVIVFISYHFVMAYFYSREGNENAYKEAKQKVTQSLIGFMIIVALVGGIFVTMLTFFGVRSGGAFDPLRLFKQSILETVPHAYAADVCPQNFGNQYFCKMDNGDDGHCVNTQCVKTTVYLGKPIAKGLCGVAMQGALCTTNANEVGVCVEGGASCDKLQTIPVTNTQSPANAQNSPTAQNQNTNNGDGGGMLPNPTSINSLYDFILAMLRLAMKFFIYPALIVIWVITGFSYVAAQGSGDKLVKAHKLLLGALITTLVVFTIQGFLMSAQQSVNNILSEGVAAIISRLV